MKDSLEEAVLENKEHFHRIKYLEDQVKTEGEKKKKVTSETDANEEKKLNLLTEAKRVLEIKHGKVCAANKTLKQEKEDLSKDLNKLNVALKSSEKEVKTLTYKFEKKVGSLEETIKELNDFKSSKLSEEKDLKLKIKKYDKKLKLIQEKEAKLVIAKKDFVKREALTVSNISDDVDSVAVEDIEEFDENLNQVNASELPVDISAIPSSVESHSRKTTIMDATILETTNKDPTISKTNMRLNKVTSATNSMEPTRSQPNSNGTLPNRFGKEPASSTTKPLEELLKGLVKNTQNLSRKFDESSRKFDESYLKCSDIKNILDKNSP